MAGSQADWDRYETWTNAIASVVFSNAAAGHPVFLDLEDDVLGDVASAAGAAGDEAVPCLVEAVRATLNLKSSDTSADVLRSHLYRLKRWRAENPSAAPPSLALLAVLSLAAENMHESGGKAAHNYYARLGELLGLNPKGLKRFEDAYRRTHDGGAASEILWGSLNEWLEFQEGNRGLPTAFAVTHAHVGPPMSQALVRRSDRERFESMFEDYGMPPHATVSATDMAQMIDEWIARIPCPASSTLEKLWNRDASSKERISDVACLALEAWDGSADSSDRPLRKIGDDIRARALLRMFPAPRLELSLVIANRNVGDSAIFEVLDASDGVITSIELIQAASGWLGLPDASVIDADSFLRGLTRLRRQGSAAVQRRRPRRLVPLRRDEIMQSFVESERVQLGEENLILARSDLATRVTDYLHEVARPGFRVHDDLEGLPSGWTLYDGVQVLTAAQPEDVPKLIDFQALQPLATSQILLQGGMSLPGNIRKWLTTAPPELRVTHEGQSRIRAVLKCRRKLNGARAEDAERAADGTVLIWDLADEGFGDGDYEISVFVGSHAASASQRATLLLRSADNPAPRLEPGEEPLGHDPSWPLFPLGATRLRKTDDAIIGALSWSADERLPRTETPEPPIWREARANPGTRSRIETQIVIPAADDSSCMVTGAHYLKLPEVLPGDNAKWIDGECSYCGLVKRQPTKWRKMKANSAVGVKSVHQPPKLKTLDPVKSPVDMQWDEAFDAVCHVGSGSFNSLRRIALQLDQSEVFVDSFARTLEALGHIEIERNDATFAPRAWEVTPPTLAGLESGGFTLVGYRSKRLVEAVAGIPSSPAVEVLRDERSPAVWKLDLDQSRAAAVAEQIYDATGMETRVAPRAGAAIAAGLEPLSTVVAALPSVSLTSARSIEWWDPIAARFQEISDTARPGAFRLQEFTRAYVYRRESDIGEGTALLGDARSVKYVAALETGNSLVGYDGASGTLYVPLGADLPGLYGRAAVLASGFAPFENPGERILEYRGVSEELAAHLNHLLMS